MDDSVRVYLNGRPVDMPRGATALDAIAAWDGAAAEQVRRGDRMIVDNRGLPAAPDSAVYAGAIFRVVSARQSRSTESPDRS